MMEGQGDEQGEASSAAAQKEAGVGASAPYSADFYIYSFKVVPCSASYAHNWSLCPFVHPNEKARRRDPRIHSYEPLPCPFDKKGANCPHGDACQYTHNIYEYWLHPKRFRTQMCQQGAACKRPLCFFAHNLQELRFAEGQQPPQGSGQAQPTAALAAAAAAGGQGALLHDLQPDARQQQAAAAAAAAAVGAGAYMPALVPYALMAAGAGAAPSGLPPGAAAAAGGMLLAGLGATAAGFSAMQPLAVSQSPQQQAWVSGFVMPQGFVVLGNPPAGTVMPAGSAVAMGSELDAGAQQQQQQHQHQQQQQQYLPAMVGHWRPSGAAAGPAVSSAGAGVAAAASGRPLQGQGYGLHLDPALNPAMLSAQYQVVPDDQVLLSQSGGIAVGDSSSSFLALQQQQQQQQHEAAAAAAAAAASGSNYSWCLNPVAPSTTTASASMSGLSMPTAGLSSTASVPGSSNNSLNHLKPGQAGTAVSLDVLQATMQQMSVRDCHVRDL